MAEASFELLASDEAATGGSFQPRTPFLSEPAYGSAVPKILAEAIAAEHTTIVETPFVNQYVLGEQVFEGQDAALFREVMEDIQDDEFSGALENLVDDVRDAFERRFVGETVPMGGEAERYLQTYVSPLRDALEMQLERMVNDAAALNEESMTDVDVETFFDGFDSIPNLGVPVFEDFFKKLFKKAKKLVKKGIKVAKRVGKVVQKFSPIHLLLGKLRKIVNPLLNRVLRFALNKIPPQYRPLARKLARRFMKFVAREAEDGPMLDQVLDLEDSVFQAEAFAADPELAHLATDTIDTEVDALLTGFIIEGEEFESDPAVVSFFAEERLDAGDTAGDLDRARARFVQELMSLEEGVDPTPQVEEFVTAILAGLKLGIKLIGRKRVVNYLAKLVARLIQRFVGKQASKPLSRALVDAGLRLVNLENEAETDEAAADVIAVTVEETIERLVAESPEEAFESDEMMEAFALEAFENAAAANFPVALLRPDLRSNATAEGTWILQPAGRRRKRYKRFSKVIPALVTLEQAKRIRTFGGQTLDSFLTEQLKLPVTAAPTNARVHVYEVIRGTTIGHIARHERDVPGLGTPDPAARIQFHPLTCEAAALLIPGHVKLCRDIKARHLVNRSRLAVGQRLYFLEIGGARMQKVPAYVATTPVPAPVRASEVNLVLNFQRKQLLIFDFLGEAAAQSLVTAMRGKNPLPALVRMLKKSLAPALQRILKGDPGRHLIIRREEPSEEDFVGTLMPQLRFAGNDLGERLLSLVVKEMMKAVSSRVAETAEQIAETANQPADGITLIVTVAQLDDVFSVLRGSPANRASALARIARKGLTGVVTFDIKPGFHSRP